MKLKPKAYPSPCDTCEATYCRGKDCERWLINYLWRQKQINAYAKKCGLKVGEGSENDDG